MLWWLAETTVVAALLAGLVMLVCRFGRFRPAVRHALWLVVLVKLVMPPFLHWPWTLPGFGETPPTAHLVADAPANPGEESLLALVEVVPTVKDPAPDEDLPLPSRMVAEDEEPGTPSQTENSPWWQLVWLPSLLYPLWLAGTAIVCFLQGLRIVRFRRLLAHTDPAPRWLDKQVAHVAATLRVRRPRARIVPGIRSPFVWSLGRPQLLWPASLLERLPREAQRSIVVHELAHLRRRDHWVGWLQLVAECLWWWNPFFWYVRRQVRLHAELACDAWVVSTLPEDRRAYAEALIEVTQLIASTAAPMPALGMSGAARHDFERRLTMIMRDRVPCRVPWVGLLAIGTMALLSLPGWSQTKVHRVTEDQSATTPEKRVIVELKTDVELPVVRDLILNKAQNVGADTHVFAVVAEPATGQDRDARLQKLERQLQELLKEVHSLRAGDPKSQRIFKTTTPATKTEDPTNRLGVRVIERKEVKTKDEAAKPVLELGVDRIRTDQPQIEHRWERVLRVHDGKDSGREITLVRITYPLPPAEAETLAKLLSQHSKVQILETKLESNGLAVTTTPEAQKAISQFVSLIHGAGAARSGDTKSNGAPAGEGRWFFRNPDGENTKKPAAIERKDP